MGPSCSQKTKLKSLESLERGFADATQWAHRHHKAVAGAVVALLLGTGITAFGVAPLAPDAADLPKRVIAETITPAELDTQIDALGEFSAEFTRSDLTRSSDTADSLLSRMGVTDASAARFLRTDPVARRVLQGRAGKMVQVQTGELGELRQLVVRYPAEQASQIGTHFTRLTVSRDAQGSWQATSEQAPLQTRVRLSGGTIRSSLFAATDESRLPDAVAIQIAEIFANEIDFNRDLRRGDHFTVVYEGLEADGEAITWNQASGRVLAAQFSNNGKAFEAVWFQEPGSKGAYFDFKGQSMRRAFLASPMEFSRVTSGFSMRFHPILKTWRRHLGVDYGAPTGTPVRTVGEGVVEFAGVQNGYGNVIYIRHSGDRETVYAHLSRIDVRKGQRVDQGQLIGAVGATGWATGPHLHFEFRQGGNQVDPLQVARSSEAVTISPAARMQFQTHALSLKTQLAAASGQRFAAAE